MIIGGMRIVGNEKIGIYQDNLNKCWLMKDGKFTEIKIAYEKAPDDDRLFEILVRNVVKKNIHLPETDLISYSHKTTTIILEKGTDDKYYSHYLGDCETVEEYESFEEAEEQIYSNFKI